jgi:hypothetical protein
VDEGKQKKRRKRKRKTVKEKRSRTDEEYQVRRRVVVTVRLIESASEVAQLARAEVTGDQNVVRFDVRMHDALIG